MNPHMLGWIILLEIERLLTKEGVSGDYPSHYLM
jgi:hypothetical protein